MKNLSKIAILAAAPVALATTATPASAGTDEYIGELMLVGYNFCPRASTEANGQLQAINSNTALFSLYGTTFGGDGRTTFGLPDLRGRTAIGQGNGPALTPRQVGQKSGQESVALTIATMPSHNHTGQVRAENTAVSDTGNPAGNALGRSTLQIYSDTAAPTAAGALHPSTLAVNNNGSGQAHDNMSPFTVMRYCVVLQGLFPSRN